MLLLQYHRETTQKVQTVIKLLIAQQTIPIKLITPKIILVPVTAQISIHPILQKLMEGKEVRLQIHHQVLMQQMRLFLVLGYRIVHHHKQLHN